jgi:hypothetical protein
MVLYDEITTHHVGSSTGRACLALAVSLSLAACGSETGSSGGAGGTSGTSGAGDGGTAGTGGDRAPVIRCSDVADPDEFFPPQDFADGFDCGRAGNRWSGPWEAVAAGSLDPAAQPPEVASETEASLKQGASSLPDNYVLQSPDPFLMDGTRGTSCTGFSAEFEEEGTFAFNYLVKTALDVGLPFSGNYFEANIYNNTVDSEGLPIESMRLNVLTLEGGVSSRFATQLPPGYYDFEFCYVRNRTGDVEGPDFVQIDDVETCVGTSCEGEVPEVTRCRVDQGATVVPDITAVPINLVSVVQVQGTSDRYHVIVNTDFLDLVIGGLDAGGPAYDILRNQIEGVREVVLVDGRTCDVDTRRSVLIEMSRSELIDLVIATGAIEAALDRLDDPATDEFFENAAELILGEIVGPFLEKFTEALILSAVR